MNTFKNCVATAKIHYSANLYYGIIKTSTLKTNRCFGSLGVIKMSCLCKICWTIKVIIYPDKNSVINITSRLIFCNTTKSLHAAIPASLKSYAFTHLDLGKLNSISENVDFQISKDVSLNLKKTSCKQFYKLFTENISIEPTAVTTWRKHCTVVADKWEQCIENNYKITRDNKLRQFYFKLLHRILVTNKELTRFGITDCTMCVMCGENDSIEHTFFECRSFLKLWRIPSVVQYISQNQY